jgi:hypothetical protein
MGGDQGFAAGQARVRADNVARVHEVALEQACEHRLGHHTGTNDPQAYVPKTLLAHVTPHLSAND